jgi:hypothetical protein
MMKQMYPRKKQIFARWKFLSFFHADDNDQMKKTGVVYGCLLAGTVAVAQVRLTFIPVFEGKEIQPGRYIKWSGGEDSVAVEKVSLYISDLSLWNSDRQVWQDADRFHLVAPGKDFRASMLFRPPASARWNRLVFYLGIDSMTNVAGVLAGDLDPSRGMYWTWQSGYINLKIEGSSNLCDSNGFAYHIGGYSGRDKCIRRIMLPAARDNIVIWIYLDRLLTKTNVKTRPRVMSPGPVAVQLASEAADMFSTEAP